VKKIDYYAPRQSWKMPKWLGITIGGIFGVIAIGSGLLILQLTHPSQPAPMASLATAPLPTAAPVAAASKVVAAPAPVATAATAAPDSPPEVADSKHHSKHHDHGKHAAAKQARLAAKKASSTSSPSPAAANRATILAKHDSKEKHHDKDALDKLLGL